jgi:hypothetical protein
MHSAFTVSGLRTHVACDHIACICLARQIFHCWVSISFANPTNWAGVGLCGGMGRSEVAVAVAEPILMLTVRDGEDDRVSALESGADDYITEPFQMRELTGRIRSAVRRYRAPEGLIGDAMEGRLAVGLITLDPSRRTVEKAAKRIPLTPQEFQALRFLMGNAGKPSLMVRFPPFFGDQTISNTVTGFVS